VASAQPTALHAPASTTQGWPQQKPPRQARLVAQAAPTPPSPQGSPTPGGGRQLVSPTHSKPVAQPASAVQATPQAVPAALQAKPPGQATAADRTQSPLLLQLPANVSWPLRHEGEVQGAPTAAPAHVEPPEELPPLSLEALPLPPLDDLPPPPLDEPALPASAATQRLFTQVSPGRQVPPSPQL
jgi:hypothetical protein